MALWDNSDTKPEKIIAYCHYHRMKPLTKQQMKTKQCLNKEHIGNHCPHLQPVQNHPFWIAREKRRLKEKEAR